MRQMIMTHKYMLLQLERVEKKLTGHVEDIALVFEYLKEMRLEKEPIQEKIFIEA